MSSGKATEPLPEVRDQARAPDVDAIRAYTRALVADPAFATSARRKQLLAYIVEQTLAGRSARLKAFDLAVAVLGRDERFDPQADPSVRVEVGRLRRDLARHYQTAGQGDPIRITIPKGRYVPAFAARDARPAPQPTARTRSGPGPRWPRRVGRGALAALAGLGALSLTAGAWWLAPWHGGGQAQQAGPAVVVVPFEPLAGGEGGRLLAAGLTAGLIADLMLFDGVQVFAGAPGDERVGPLPSAATGLPAYVVGGSVERGSDRVRVTGRLTDGSSGEVLWSTSYDRILTTDEIFEVQSELTGAIVERLAQVYGVINRAAAKQLGQRPPATLFGYDCVQRAFAYRRTFAPDLYPPVRACLEEVVRRDPGYAAAWAMLGFAHMDAARFGIVVEPTAKSGEYRAGLAAARRAVELAPGSVLARQSLAALLYATGDFDAAERVQRRAIALNPNNPESLAQLGWRLVARGRSNEGRALLQDAIVRSAVVPAWYHQCLAVALYLGGDLSQARDEAELGKRHCCGHGHATLAITEAAVEHPAAARAALAEAVRQALLLARDPAAFWADFHVAPDVVDRLNAGLAKAGLELPRAPAATAPRS